MAADPDPPRRRARVDQAAMASNWRQVLVVDAAVGAVVVVAGLVVALFLSPAVGILISAAGIAYLVGGLLRWRRWARLRAAAGLDAGGDETQSP